jgi:hypothetical protein
MIGKKFGPDISYNKRLSKSVAKKKLSRKPASKPTGMEKEVIDYFKKKGTYSKYKEDGSLTRRIAKGVQMAKKAREVKEDPWEGNKEKWEKLSTSHSWQQTKKTMSNYDSFIKQVEKRLGRKLGITTAGGATSQHSTEVGALDIGKGDNTLTDAEYDMIGKLALEYGYRVGDEANHLHIDSRPREEAPNRVFYNLPGPQANREQREARKELGTFKKYDSKRKEHRARVSSFGDRLQKMRTDTGEAKQTNWNQKANEAVEKEKRESNVPISPMSTLRQSQEPKEEAKRESVKKMSIARDADFGIYN